MKQQYLTKDGLGDLKDKLGTLKTVRRREIATAIHTAKEQGDLSENAEYQQAKEDQQRVEEEISSIESTIKHARVIKKSNGDEVDIGSTVTLECGGKQSVYMIVGSNEADPLHGKISNESPMGQALLHKKSSEAVAIPTPGGDKACTVVSIS